MTMINSQSINLVTPNLLWGLTLATSVCFPIFWWSEVRVKGQRHQVTKSQNQLLAFIKVCQQRLSLYLILLGLLSHRLE